jgi:HD superfamily phosphodiesterase
MPISKCPGQEKRNWKSEDLFDAPCPHCGQVLEFWKTEPRRRCFGCGKNVLNPKLELGCAQWCQHAADCLGFSPASREADTLADSLIAEMKRYFGDDQRRIAHALEVLSYAEIILTGQIFAGESADPLVVKAAAILHDIGIPEAIRKHGSPAAEFQELEGPPIARAILEKFPIDVGRVNHICRIIGSHHHPKELAGPELDTPEFRILWDADRLGNAADEGPADPHQIAEYLQTMYRTDAGRSLAARKLQKQP